MKKRILVLALTFAMTLGTMPAFALEGAAEALNMEQQEVTVVDTMSEPTEAAETKAEEVKEEVTVTAEKEEQQEVKALPGEKQEKESLQAEEVKSEEAVQPKEEKAEKAEAKEEAKAEEKVQEESEKQAEAEALPEASPAKTKAAKAPAKAAAATTLKVVWHFNILGEDGEYKEAKAYTQSVKTGGKTTNIAISTATSYVKPSTVAVDGKTFNYVTSWKDANGNAVTFPLSRTFEEIEELAGDETTVDVQLYAQYRKQIRITLHFNEVRRANGTMINYETSNNISGNGGWNFTKKKLENSTGLREGDTFSYGGYKYTYTGKWIDGNDNIIDSSSSISLNNKAGETSGNNYYLSEDTDLYFMPIYEKTMIQGLDYFYIDNISTGSGSWSNRNSEGIRSDFSEMSHTFKDPEAGTPQDHYNFVYWMNDETGETFGAGDKFTYKVDSSLPEGTVTEVKIYAYWQPSVIVNYHVQGETVKTVESFDEAIEAYGFEPELEGAEFIGWYASEEEDAERAADDASYSAPAVTKKPVEQKTIDLYAKFQTNYTVEHYLEQLDGTFELAEDETELIEGALVGAKAEAEEKEFEGFTFDENIEGTLREAEVEPGLALRLYYSRNSYMITYEYTGEDIPENADEMLPETSFYTYGAKVRTADMPVVEGYEFSGWIGEVEVMPASDVKVMGSWKQIPAEEPLVTEPEDDSDKDDDPSDTDPEDKDNNKDNDQDKKTDNKKAEKDDPAAPAAVISDQNTPTTPGTPDGDAEAPAEAAEEMADQAVPMAVMEDAGAPMATVEDAEVPMAATGAWALVNLIMMIVTILGSLIMMIRSLRRKQETKNEEEETIETKRRRRGMRLLTIVPALASLAAFILTENMSLPMILTDKWTLLMAVILIVQAVLMIVSRDKKTEEAAEYEEGMVNA